MPKTPKIDVITVKLTCHIPVDRSDRESVDKAYAIADDLGDEAAMRGATSYDTRLNRVPAPEPVADELDIPPAPEPSTATDIR